MPDATEDQLLVRRILAGDAEAFEDFGRRYSRALYRFALPRLAGDRERTRDVVQTALCKALAKLDTYRGEASLLTWLCSCCRNEILMGFRSRRAVPREEELGDALQPAVGFWDGPPASPEAGLLQREVAAAVHAVLDSLPDRYARALEWKYVERSSVKEIAARLGLGAKAAESLLTRARLAFRKGWEDLMAVREGTAAARAPRELHHG